MKSQASSVKTLRFSAHISCKTNAQEYVSCCHDHEQHHASTSWILSHCRNPNAFVFQIDYFFYRNFSFNFLYFLFFFCLFFFFSFLPSVLFLALQQADPHSICFRFQSMGSSSAAVVASLTFLNFSEEGINGTLDWGLAILYFLSGKKKKHPAPTISKSVTFFFASKVI